MGVFISSLRDALRKIAEYLGAVQDSFSGLPAPHADTHLVGKSDALQTPGVPLTVTVGGTAARGGGPSYMRGDAQLVVGAGTPTQPTGQVAALGSAFTAMRSDATIKQGIVTTKGDILTFGTLPDRLPVGANGLAVVADSAVALGIKWAAPASAAHNLLSTTHGDTAANAPLRGALIVGNATPAWARLALGAAGLLLKSDGTDAVWGQVTPVVLRPAQVTANQNDYSAGTLDQNHTTVFVNTDASRDFSGYSATGSVDGTTLLWINNGSFDEVLQHENAGSAAANRLTCPGAGNLTLLANGCVRFVRDATTARWRVFEL